MIAIASLVGTLLVSLLVAVGMTYAMTRFLQLPGATWRRAIGVVFWIGLIETIALLLFVILYRWGANPAVLEGVLLLFAALLPLVVYSRAYGVKGLVLAAFFGLQVAQGAAALGLGLFMKSYLTEAFKISANSMAPTLYGYRAEAVCPKCGGPAVKTLPQDEEDFDAFRGGPEPCIRCGTPTKFAGNGDDLPPDRIMIEKLGEPERWELAVFRSPEDPSLIYVKRLVGLPGETITIRDGYVYADEQKLQPPPDAGELRYLSKYDEFGLGFRDPSAPDTLWGDPARPVKLGADEFFLLGDHTRRSLDCRFYGPVRRDALVGTASVIYWPPERWRLLK